MKKITLPLLLAALLTASPVFAHEGHGQAVHGGIVAEAGHAQFEIVAKAGQITVYASNHGAPLATTGANGKLTVLSGAHKEEIVLLPAGEDLLQGKGSLNTGDKVLLSVSWPGKKPLQARAVVQ
ncbi:hypothetical protein [Azonexus sp.]|uniref:hypothetical protein n=1 Tax=Azonexus sp. TaxID=1872668 RepID=UPI0039E5B7CC